MITIVYAPSFLRQMKKLDARTIREAKMAITLFQKKGNHKKLGVHKLKGKLAERMSFSVSFHYRIIFQHLSVREVAFLAIGDHSIYQ